MRGGYLCASCRIAIVSLNLGGLVFCILVVIHFGENGGADAESVNRVVISGIAPKFNCSVACFHRFRFMRLEWYVTSFGNIDHKASDGLKNVVEDYHGGNDSE